MPTGDIALLSARLFPHQVFSETIPLPLPQQQLMQYNGAKAPNNSLYFSFDIPKAFHGQVLSRCDD